MALDHNKFWLIFNPQTEEWDMIHLEPGIVHEQWLKMEHSSGQTNAQYYGLTAVQNLIDHPPSKDQYEPLKGAALAQGCINISLTGHRLLILGDPRVLCTHYNATPNHLYSTLMETFFSSNGSYHVFSEVSIDAGSKSYKPTPYTRSVLSDCFGQLNNDYPGLRSQPPVKLPIDTFPSRTSLLTNNGTPQIPQI